MNELTDETAAAAAARLRAERINNPCPLADPSTVSRELAVALAREFPPEEITRMIRSLCSAKRTTKNGIEPDTRANEAGLKLLLAYQEGLPVQRIVQRTTTAVSETDEQMMARMMQSPAFVAGMREMLAKAGAVDVGDGSK